VSFAFSAFGVFSRRRLLRAPRRGAFWRLLASTIALALFAGCVGTPAPRIPLAAIPAAQQDRAARNVAVFSAAWSLVADRHFDPRLHGLDWPALGRAAGAEAAAAPDDTALYAALNRMLEPLGDSHTHALTPAQAAARRARARARTGFNMTRLDGRWAVWDVLPESPAARAGVRRGWIAVARNGAALGDRPDFQPRAGETARWEFLDTDDRPVALALTAEPLPLVPPPQARLLPGGFVQLRFDAFATPDRRWLGAQLKAHRDAPGVVIDLRRNPGGDTFSLGISVGEFFDRAVDCGRFVTRGGMASTKRSFGLGSARYAGRVALLVDGATASAAEIFAAVLQAHHRAVVIGRPTAGAVLASWFHRLPDGGELQLSREDYIAPQGYRLEGRGVTPDIASAFSLADLRAGRDPDLAAALAWLETDPRRP